MTEDLSKKGILCSGEHFSIFTILVDLKSVFSRIRAKVDRESCYRAFVLLIKIIQFVSLLLFVYSPTFSFVF